jgi:starch synthase
VRAALITREYPPYVYGGAGVHVEYLSRELARKIEVDVHCWGDQQSSIGNLYVHGAKPWDALSAGQQKFKTSLEALSLNLLQLEGLSKAELVHTHTWYASMAGFWAKKLFNIPFVLTTHSLEPLRAWKAEQLGTGFAMSSWMERTAILDADAVIAVSQGTRTDILKAYPDIDPARIHVIYNGIDLAEYQKTDDVSALKAYGVNVARPYILFVGRITRQKGVTHLVDAIRYLPADTQVVQKLPPNCARRSKASAQRIRTLSGSRRWSPRPRPFSFTATARSSVALLFTNHSASSTSKPWPAARLWSPALPAGFSRWWSMERPAISSPLRRTR